jgi:hypothetical protein
MCRACLCATTGDQEIEDNIPPISVSKMTEFLTSRFKITVSYYVMLDFYSPAFAFKALACARRPPLFARMVVFD